MERERVELHLHTNMSKMDGVCSAERLIRQAAAFGHQAVAITDHGVAQAFPEAMRTADRLAREGTEIKVVYGMEAYVIDDTKEIVDGGSYELFDGEFIVVDLETTGLSAIGIEEDRITRIGAVRVKNGAILEEFATFVNPCVHIRDRVTELNGISDDTVKDAPKEKEALERFAAFCGSCKIFVAHHAVFISSFLREAYRRCGMLYSYTTIDTCAISKALYPKLRRFSLETIATRMRLSMPQNRQPFDDVQIEARIFLRLLRELQKKRGMRSTADLNALLPELDFRGEQAFHLTLLVQNRTGLKNLYRLISMSHLKHFYKKSHYHDSPYIMKSELIKHREGLLIGSACEKGALFHAVMLDAPWEKLCELAGFCDFLEIQPAGVHSESLRNQGRISELNRKVVRLGTILGKPVCATGDVHFCEPEEEILRNALYGTRIVLDEVESASMYFRSTDEMFAEFADLGAEKAYEVVVENPNRIADRCEKIKPIPDGIYEPHLDGAEDSLAECVWSRARELYGDAPPKIVQERLEKELSWIVRHEYATRFVIAQKVAQKAAEQGPTSSRGAVGSSLTAYLAGITEVNPLPPHYVCPKCRYTAFVTDGSVASGFDLPEKSCPACGEALRRSGQEIPAEAFFGFGGHKVPDIDLNVTSGAQPAVYAYLRTIFGEGRVLKGGNTVKSPCRVYADACGLSPDREALARLSKRCDAVKRGTSQIPYKTMIIPEGYDVYDFTPVQYADNDAESGILITHFDAYFLRDALLELDLPEFSTNEIGNYLEEYTGVRITDVPVSDPEVYGLLTSPEALGVPLEEILWETGTLSLPGLSTDFAQHVLKKTQPKSFSDLIQTFGLLHGTGVWRDNAEELISGGTCRLRDVIAVREEIMTDLMRRGMDPENAYRIMELVRKGKAARGLFTEEDIAAMRACGVPDWYLESCRKILYLFPKAHAAAEALAAVRMGWYKINRPTAYYAAYFTVYGDGLDMELFRKEKGAVKREVEKLAQESEHAAIGLTARLSRLRTLYEALARGVAFLPPERGKSHERQFLPEDGAIRLPLVCLK